MAAAAAATTTSTTGTLAGVIPPLVNFVPSSRADARCRRVPLDDIALFASRANTARLLLPILDDLALFAPRASDKCVLLLFLIVDVQRGTLARARRAERSLWLKSSSSSSSRTTAQ